MTTFPLVNQTFYVATSLAQRDLALHVIDLIERMGGSVPYNWAALPDLRGKKGAELEQALTERGQFDLEGVMRADRTVVILPGGSGAHFEFGAAVAIAQARNSRKPVLFVPEGTDLNAPYPCVFHHIAKAASGTAAFPFYHRIDGTLADLVAALVTL